MIGQELPKTTDLGEKLDPLHLVFDRAVPSQTAVIAVKDSFLAVVIEDCADP